MRFWAAPLAVCLAATTAQAAGLQRFEIAADGRGPRIEAVLWTPCATPPKAIAIDPPLEVRAVMNCPVEGSNLPLIVMSHGGGAGPLLNHDTAEALADAGFMVVALAHPNDPVGGLDNSWMLQRPTDVKRTLDFMLHAAPARGRIDPRRIGFFGFSRGGYTGLILAGAVPHFPWHVRLWQKLALLAFHRGQPMPLLGPDPRYRAFAIVDPFAAFFDDSKSVEKIRAPMQVWSSEEGGAGVTADINDRLARALPVKPDYHLVPHTNHSSFALVCTPAIVKVAADFCADPPGFDRAAFHKLFNARVVAFFQRTLGN